MNTDIESIVRPLLIGFFLYGLPLGAVIGVVIGLVKATNDLRRARVHHISKLSEHPVPFIEDFLTQFRIFLRGLLLKIKLLVQQFLLKSIRKLRGEPGADNGPGQGGKDR